MEILIVDDEKLIQKYIKEYSLDAGFTVKEADDGKEALQLFE